MKTRKLRRQNETRKTKMQPGKLLYYEQNQNTNKKIKLKLS